MKQSIIKIINKFPYIRGLYAEVQHYKQSSCFSPGHFYSPLMNPLEIKEREVKIWRQTDESEVLGINFNVDNQLALLKDFEAFYGEIPFDDEKKQNLRYYFNNGFYSYTDAITLYSVIRKYSPSKIIEVGSGYSSAIMLDTREYFNKKIELTFIEPYPDRLYSLLKEGDENSTVIEVKKVQDVDLDVFRKLSENDILFIDSSHVSKTDSDLNFLMFEVIPRLKKGVLIHFHDVFFPFEYPKDWVLKGRNWNEDYLLRAFLMYNNTFDIIFFAHHLHTKYSEAFRNMPLCYKNKGGNIWLQKKV